MPGPLITRRDIANAAISGQPRKFDKFGGKSRAARIFFYFKTAGVAVGMPHALGRTPTAWRVVSISRVGDGSTVAGSAPGTVYAPVRGSSGSTETDSESIHSLGRNFVVLACSTANTWAEIEVT